MRATDALLQLEQYGYDVARDGADLAVTFTGKEPPERDTLRPLLDAVAADKVDVLAVLLNREKPELHFGKEVQEIRQALEQGAPAVVVLSRTLEKLIVFARDDVPADSLPDGLAVYRLGELPAMAGAKLADLELLTAAKELFGGDLVRFEQKDTPATAQHSFTA